MTATSAGLATGAYQQPAGGLQGNYTRLAQVKERCDADNIFHVNQNIQLAVRPGER